MLRGGEEGEDAAAKFLRLEAEGGGVIGAGHDPQLFGAAGGSINHFGVAAGERVVLAITDKKDGRPRLSPARRPQQKNPREIRLGR
jgi:hypothetical protein